MKQEQLGLEAAKIQPESCHPGRVSGKEVAIFNVESQLYATQANCTHRGGPLCEGALWGHTITCPWHGSEFDVRTGEVVTGPATEPLVTYRVEVQDGLVVVGET